MYKSKYAKILRGFVCFIIIIFFFKLSQPAERTTETDSISSQPACLDILNRLANKEREQ